MTQAEIVFCDQHFCNDNLKLKKPIDISSDLYDEDGRPKFVKETFIKQTEEIIEENDKSKNTLKALEKVRLKFLFKQLEIWRRP